MKTFVLSIVLTVISAPAIAQMTPRQFQEERQRCANDLAYSRVQGFLGDIARTRLQTCIQEGLVAAPASPRETDMQCRANGVGGFICDSTTQ